MNEWGERAPDAREILAAAGADTAQAEALVAGGGVAAFFDARERVCERGAVCESVLVVCSGKGEPECFQRSSLGDEPASPKEPGRAYEALCFGRGAVVGAGALWEESPTFLQTVVAVDDVAAVRVPRTTYEAVAAGSIGAKRRARDFLRAHVAFAHADAASRATWLRGVSQLSVKRGGSARRGRLKENVFLLERGAFRVIATRQGATADETDALATLYGRRADGSADGDVFGVMEHVDPRSAGRSGRRDLRVLTEDALLYEVDAVFAKMMAEDPLVRGAWLSLARHRSKWEEATAAVICAARGSRVRVNLDVAQMKVARYLSGPHLRRAPRASWSRVKKAVADSAARPPEEKPRDAFDEALAAARLKRQSAPALAGMGAVFDAANDARRPRKTSPGFSAVVLEAAAAAAAAEAGRPATDLPALVEQPPARDRLLESRSVPALGPRPGRGGSAAAAPPPPRGRRHTASNLVAGLRETVAKNWPAILSTSSGARRKNDGGVAAETPTPAGPRADPQIRRASAPPLGLAPVLEGRRAPLSPASSFGAASGPTPRSPSPIKVPHAGRRFFAAPVEALRFESDDALAAAHTPGAPDRKRAP